MNPVTPEMVVAAIREHGIDKFHLRSCSMCNSPLFYLISGERIAFDPNCLCGREMRWPEPRSVQDLVHTFNMQTPEIRERMWQQFINKEPAR